MNRLIQEYIDATKNAAELVRLANTAVKDTEERADAAKVPEHIRPAKAEDIVEGAIIWYPSWKAGNNDDADREWNLVDEVLNPSDEWKAYCAHDGCRYGLDGAFVELQPFK